jgi:tRNA 2-selenouridine synthase
MSESARDPDCLSDSDRDLLELLVNQTPLIDVRAPIEFTRGALPGAVNLPLLNDEERATIGTEYKENGQTSAIELGHRIITGENLAHKMKAWREFAERYPRAWIYCFRGGLRSQSVHAALTKSGLQLSLIPGGYKRLRQLLIDIIETTSSKENFAVISGLTGSGKSVFLRRLARETRVCDLELHARHRGSSFGRQVESQPTQINFENELAVALYRLWSQPPAPILIEDESRTIGRIVIPPALFGRLSHSPMFVIEKPLETRARFLISIYLLENYGLTDGAPSDPVKLQALRSDMHRNVDGIARALGGKDTAFFKSAIDSAIADHNRTNKIDSHLPWVQHLLTRYYDPLYERHISQQAARIVARGSEDEILSSVISLKKQH